MKTSKGFTIIELLVVIAIIAVLAAVVMVNVTSYVGKAKDSNVKANLAQIPTMAAIVYDDAAGSYAALCADANVDKAFDAAIAATGEAGFCNDDANTWVVCVGLEYDAANSWCIDSTSAAKTITDAQCTASITACP